MMDRARMGLGVGEDAGQQLDCVLARLNGDQMKSEVLHGLMSVYKIMWEVYSELHPSGRQENTVKTFSSIPFPLFHSPDSRQLHTDMHTQLGCLMLQQLQ